LSQDFNVPPGQDQQVLVAGREQVPGDSEPYFARRSRQEDRLGGRVQGLFDRGNQSIKLALAWAWIL
jgi:hypothetical protein